MAISWLRHAKKAITINFNVIWLIESIISALVLLNLSNLLQALYFIAFPQLLW